MNLIKTNPTDTQKDAIKFFLEKGCAGIRHGTGLGKTFISLFSLAYLLSNDKIDACYIFVIKSAIDAFKNDFAKHTNLNYSIIYNREDYNKKDKIYLIQYNRIDEFKDIILSENRRLMAVADECFVLKNPKIIKDKKEKISNRAQCLFDIRHKFDYVIGLSAMPLGNNLMDLYHITNFIFPNFYTNEYAFKYTFHTISKEKTWDKKLKKFRYYNKITGYKNLDLLRDIISTYWHCAFLPIQIDFNLGNCPTAILNDEEERLYLSAARGILDNKKNEIKYFLNRLPDLQRVVDLSQTKINLFINFINELLKKEHGIIVYFELKEPIKYLKDKLNAEVKVLTGETSLEKRSEIRKWFGPNKVILMSNAGSRSLNLEEGDVLVFYTVPWSLETFAQSVGRIARPLTSKYLNIDVYIPYIKNTIDEYRRENILNDVEVINRVLDGNDPNLPNNLNILKRNIIEKMRKELLWRM